VSKLDEAAAREITAMVQNGHTASDLVERARNPNSPLHPHFEWDDSRAAQAHRVAQAERLIVRARVTIVPSPAATPRTIRASCQPPPRPSRPAPPPRPVAPAAASSRPAAARPVQLVPPAPMVPVTDPLKAALEELSAWRERYREVPDLRRMMFEIDRLLSLSRLRAAVAYARQLERDGVDRQNAAERAATQYEQPRNEVLALLRAG
jgi:hypothetical protein